MQKNRMKKSVLLVTLWLLAGCAGAIATSPASPAGSVPTANAPAGAGATAASLPVTWGGHGLTGRLLLIQYHQTGDTLIELDLQTGQVTVLFQAPKNSKLLAASLSPDGKQLVLAYAAPIPGQIQLGNTDLYLLAAGTTDPPTLLEKRNDSDESFFGPVWAPDGQSIIYAHFFKTVEKSTAVYHYAIERVDLAGKSTTLIPDAYWPAVSPDGSEIAYVYSDPKGFSNDLYIADASGKNSRPLTGQNGSGPVDAHIFSADGKTVFFSMVNPQPQSEGSWWDSLFGVRTASAHNVPSDWYKVPVAGGTIERVTQVNDTGMVGAISPDDSHMAFTSLNGLFAVKVDGSDLVKLTDLAFEGSIQWLP